MTPVHDTLRYQCVCPHYSKVKRLCGVYCHILSQQTDPSEKTRTRVQRVRTEVRRVSSPLSWLVNTTCDTQIIRTDLCHTELGHPIERFLIQSRSVPDKLTIQTRPGPQDFFFLTSFPSREVGWRTEWTSPGGLEPHNDSGLVRRHETHVVSGMSHGNTGLPCTVRVVVQWIHYTTVCVL